MHPVLVHYGHSSARKFLSEGRALVSETLPFLDKATEPDVSGTCTRSRFNHLTAVKYFFVSARNSIVGDQPSMIDTVATWDQKRLERSDFKHFASHG